METVANWLTDAVGPSYILWLAIGFAVMVIVEVVKGFTRGVGGKWKKLDIIKVSGAGSLVLAAVLSLAFVYAYDLNVFELFETLKNTDPELANIISSAITLGIARWLHASGKQGPV